jgi:fibronectin-binding autotransporter adhesin
MTPPLRRSSPGRILTGALKPVSLVFAVGAIMAGLAPGAWAGTPKDVVNGQSDLTLDTTYTPATFPSAADDVRWTAIPYTPQTFTISGAVTVDYGTLNSLATNDITIQNGTAATASTLRLNGGSNSVAPSTSDLLYVSGANLTIQNGTGTLGVSLLSGGNLDIAGASVATINSVVTSGAGNALNKTGSGNLIFGGANSATLASNITVAAGTLTNSAAGALGSGVLTLGVSGGGNATILNATNVTLANAISVANVAGATLRIGTTTAANQSPTFSGAITLQSGANVTLGNSPGTGTSNMTVTTVNGNATNTITIDGGTTGTVNFSTANAALTSAFNVISGVLSNGFSNGTGGANAGEGGLVTLGATSGAAPATLSNGNTNFNNNITVASGGTGERRISTNRAANGTFGTYRGTLTAGSAVTIGGGNQTGVNANALNYNGAITGSSTITLDAGFSTNVAPTTVRGIVSLGGDNSAFTGNYNITSGDVRANAANSFNNAANVVAIGSQVLPGGTTTARLILINSSTIAGLNDLAGTSGEVQKLNAGTSVLTLGGGGNYAFGGVISNPTGTVQINKNGAGTQLLNGANTYTGATNINAGTLGGTGSLTGSAVTVVGSAALQGGNGTTASGAFSVNGNVNLQDASIIKLTVGAGNTHSTLARTGGTWVFDDNQAFTLFNAQSGTYDNIITGLTGTEAGLASIGTWTVTNPFSTGTFTFDGTNVDLSLTVVPEPSTFVMLLGGLGVLMAARRFRRVV